MRLSVCVGSSCHLKGSQDIVELLQKAIIEEFAPRFAPHSECLYVGDTIEKDLVKNIKLLSPK